jgi:hypothetical protein
MGNGSGRGWVRRLLRAEGDPLVRIGWAIGTMLVLAVAVAAIVTIVGASVLDIHGTKTEPLSATTLYDLLKIAFAVAAGVGGVIALVTAYRRQRYIEFAQALGTAERPAHQWQDPAVSSRGLRATWARQRR